MSREPTVAPEQKARVLVADDEAELCRAYVEVLRQAGHEAEGALHGDEVLERIRGRRYDLVLADLVIPPSDGIALLEAVKRLHPATLVVVFSGAATVDQVLAAFRKGAFDFLLKPVEADTLCRLAARAAMLREQGEARRRMAEALETERLRVVELRRRLGLTDPFHKIVGSSPAMAKLVDALQEVARTDSTILLTGESGTGKGLVARVIHEASARRDGPFVEANCVVYSEGVLHSELFGHERGAFTGAAKLKRGRFELARGGTLFLDEIGEISPATQLLLLRVLQDRTFERVGGEETLEADVRLIAATNRDLEEAMRRGAFRSDLYYRLNVIPIHLPPLRERREDIPLLAHHFLHRCGARLGRDFEGFEAGVLETFEHYAWPGNIRELENTIERMAVLARGPRLGREDLPPHLRQRAEPVLPAGEGTLRDLERQRILQVLREAGGNKKRAARLLGIHRSTLYAKLRRYGLGEPGDEGSGREVRPAMSGNPAAGPRH